MWEAFSNLTGWLWGIPLFVTIGAAGILFTVATKFFQIRKLGMIITNPFKKSTFTEEGAQQKLSPFQAVSIAIGGSVGVSNISGVGTAIATGGPGALFWLWIAALLGMMIKMAEVTLAVYYRESDGDGNYWGGPTYYMMKGLGKEKKWGKVWIPLAAIFGGGLFITFFITIQNYTVGEAVGSTFGINPIIPSAFMVLGYYLIIMGGMKKLGQIASYLVPIMCLFYIGCVIVVLIMNASAIPGAFGSIFKGAFTYQAAVGGFAGAAVTRAIQLGFARSVYSNEAGWGTSPMVHASASVEHPVKQGLMGAFEVFMDTIVVCTATGLLVIVTGFWNSGLEGSVLTLTALEANLGGFARIIVALSIFFFGLTTSTGWYSYYLTLLNHAFKDSKAKKTIIAIYRILNPWSGFIITVITVQFAVLPSQLWTLADFSSVIPTFVNVLVVILLSGKFLQLLKDYNARYLGKGTVDPNFKPFYDSPPRVKGSQD